MKQFGKIAASLLLLAVSSVVAPAAALALENAQRLLKVADRLAQCGEHEQALSYMNRAIRLSPEDPALYRSRGKILYKLGRYQAAVEDFGRSIKGDPATSSSVLYRRALAYKHLKQYQKAIDDLTESAKGERRPKKLADMRLERAESYAALKKWKKAVDDYSAYLLLHPDSQRRGEVLSLRAKTYEKLGDKEKAGKDRDTARALGFSG